MTETPYLTFEVYETFVNHDGSMSKIRLSRTWERPRHIHRFLRKGNAKYRRYTIVVLPLGVEHTDSEWLEESLGEQYARQMRCYAQVRYVAKRSQKQLA